MRISGLHRSVAVIAFALLVGICVCLIGCNRGNEVGLNPGDISPDLPLEDLNGKKVNLSAYHSDLVLLNFWTSWCVPCIAEMHQLETVHNRLKDRGFRVVAVAVEDDIKAVKRIVEEKKLSFPVLFDRAGKSKQLYKLGGYPETFLLGKQGRVLLVADPIDGTPVVRFRGPREWTSPLMISYLLELISSGDNRPVS